MKGRYVGRIGSVRFSQALCERNSPKMKLCLLCRKEQDRLATAHIFARGFFNKLPGKTCVESVSLSDSSRRKLPSALYDNEIICDDCEHGVMEPLDSYAIKIVRDREGMFRVPLHPETPMSLLVFDGVDKRMIRAFLASVLWRCSVSRQPEIYDISVGTVYERRIRNDLLHNGDFTYVDMVLFYLAHPMHGAFLLPTKKRLKPLDANRDWQTINGWIIQFPNISLTVSLDKRPNPHRVFLSLAPDLTGNAEDLLASTCLNADAKEHHLLAFETETQDNHMEYILSAIRRRGMESHNKTIQARRYRST